MDMHRKPRRLKALALMCASLSLALSACTAALEPLEPAAPKSTPSGQQSSEQAAKKELNPYAAGAVKSWHVGLPSAPSFIAYDEKSRTFVVAVDQVGAVRSAQIKTFATAGTDQVLEQWSVDLPQLNRVTALAVADNTIFVNGTNRSGTANFISINLTSGSVRNDGARSASRDGEEAGVTSENSGNGGSAVPHIVGTYAQGVGVISATPVALVAELLDGHGSVHTADLPLDNESLQAGSSDEHGGLSAGAAAFARVSFARNLANTQLPALKNDVVQTQVPMSMGTQFVGFPQLGVMNGDECYAVADGFVCIVFALNTAHDEQAQKSGQTSRQAPGQKSAATAQSGSAQSEQQAPTTNDTVAAGNEAAANPGGAASADTTADSSADLIAVVSEYNVNGHQVRQSNAHADSMVASVIPVGFSSAITARELADALVAADKTDRKAGEKDTFSPTSRTEAMLYDGVWLKRAQWHVPEGGTLDGARAVAGMAPLYQLSSGAIVNAATGTVLTSKNAIGYQGIAREAQMLFEFVNGELVYLVPAGQAG